MIPADRPAARPVLDLDDFDPERTSGTRLRTATAPVDSFDARVDAALARKQARRRGPPSVGDATFAKQMVEAREMARSGDWSLAKPSHFVAHFAVLHESVYGIAPVDLPPSVRGRAAGVLAQLLRREFGWSPAAEVDERAKALAKFATFWLWAWRRERNRETWRRDNGRVQARRITWMALFGGSIYGDFVDELRRRQMTVRR